MSDLGVEQSKMSIWCERNGKMWRTLKPYLTIRGTRCQGNLEWLRLAWRIALLPSGLLVYGSGPLPPTPTRTPARDLPALDLMRTGRAWSVDCEPRICTHFNQMGWHTERQTHTKFLLQHAATVAGKALLLSKSPMA